MQNFTRNSNIDFIFSSDITFTVKIAIKKSHGFFRVRSFKIYDMSGVGDNFQLKIKHNHCTRLSTTIITDTMAVELIILNSMKSRNWGISWDFISFGADWGGWWSSIVADLLDMIEYQPTYKHIGCRPRVCPLLGLYRKDAYAKTRFRGRVRFIKIRRVVGMIMKYKSKQLCDVLEHTWW